MVSEPLDTAGSKPGLLVRRCCASWLHHPLCLTWAAPAIYRGRSREYCTNATCELSPPSAPLPGVGSRSQTPTSAIWPVLRREAALTWPGSRQTWFVSAAKGDAAPPCCPLENPSYPPRRNKSGAIVTGKWIAYFLDLAASCFGNLRYRLQFLLAASPEGGDPRLHIPWGSGPFANCACRTMPLTPATKTPQPALPRKSLRPWTPVPLKQLPALCIQTVCVGLSHRAAKYRTAYYWLIYEHASFQT